MTIASSFVKCPSNMASKWPSWVGLTLKTIIKHECNGSFDVFVVQMVLYLEVVNNNSLIEIIKMYHLGDL
jgi:hypothetical protein